MLSSSLRETLSRTLAHALAWREAESSTPVAATATRDELFAHLNVPLTETGIPPAEIIDELVAAAKAGLANTTGGRFFGWVIGGSLPSALAADWLTSAWDQNAGAFAVSPAPAVCEEVCGTWLKELLHIPAESSFALVTGCQMAHVTALAAARHHLLAARGIDSEREGLFAAPRIRILTSSEVHGTVPRAARLLGFGTSSITQIASNDRGQLPPDALEAALAATHDAPIIVILQAGDLNLGAFDDFEALIPIAHRYNAWVHVDGAFGLWCAASPRFEHLMRSAELADSWATDGHKWLNVPYDCGYAFVRHPEAHRAAFSVAISYVAASIARDSMDWNPEFSRRARSFATYAALRELGRKGVAELIDRCCDACHALATRIGELPGAELLAEPQINQGVVRFLSPAANASADDHNHFTDRVTAAILAAGEALFSNTTWRSHRAMRISVCNWQTSTEDVDRVVSAVAGALESCRAATGYKSR